MYLTNTFARISLLELTIYCIFCSNLTKVNQFVPDKYIFQHQSLGRLGWWGTRNPWTKLTSKQNQSRKNNVKMKKYRFKMKCNAGVLCYWNIFFLSLLLMFVGSFWGFPVFICWRYAIIVGDYVMHWVFFGFDNTFKWHTVLRSPVIICWRYAIIMSDHVRKHGDYSLLRM